MTLDQLTLDPPKRLAHLPLIMDVLRRTGVPDIIDAACGIDRRMKSSHGECVCLIVLGVFAGEHGLWRLQDRLDVFDMATVMQDAGFDLAEFHDVRLGRALDALYRAGPDKILTELALKIIEAFSLGTDYLHFDTTTLSFYGDYEHPDHPDWSPEIDEVPSLADIPAAMSRAHSAVSGDGRLAPLVTRGYAKNKRHDLKQMLYGSVVTRDGGVPLYGRSMDGNSSDITAATEFMDLLRQQMPHPQQQCFVADSKGWSGRVLTQVHDHQLRLLSRLPRTTTLCTTCLDMFDITTAPCLLKKYSEQRQRWSYVAYQGSDATYTFIPEQLDQSDQPVKPITMPVRVITCFSSELFRQKLKTFGNVRQREHHKHTAWINKVQRRQFACEADAQAAADQYNTQQPWVAWSIIVTVVERTVTAKRSKRGRPKAGEPAPTTQTVYRLTVTVSPADDDHAHSKLRRAATYVLIRNRYDDWHLSDEEMVRAYGEQWRIEHGFAWLKSDAGINPAFLENNNRLEALFVIYHIALMTHTLIQRNIRAGLKRRDWKLPYHRNKPSQNITARFTYELFRNITTQTITLQKQTEKRRFGTTEHTDKAIIALNLSKDAYRPVW